MSSPSCQPGLLAPLASFGRALSFRPLPDADVSTGLLALQQGFDLGWGVVGLGEPLVRALGATVPGLRTFPALSGPACVAPSTQQALWILLTAEDRSAVFERSEVVTALLASAFALVDAVDTFKYREGRDLTGYEDGTENPEPEESVGVALHASKQAGLAGSSFVAVQRWVHDLQRFHAHPRHECDAMIGRRRDTNEEIDDAPASAHVKRSAQESFAPEAYLVRRSMPWVCGTSQGLEFIAYGHALDAFENILRRMLGLDDGIVDGLFRFSTPVTGGYYWCPPIVDQRLDLRWLS